MALDDPAHEGEAEADPGLLRREVRLERDGRRLRGHAHPGVGHEDGDRRRVRRALEPHREGEPAAPGHGLESVEDEVEEAGLEQLGVGDGRREARGSVHLDLDGLVAGLVLHEGGRLAHDGPHVARARVEPRRLAGGEEVADEAVEARHLRLQGRHQGLELAAPRLVLGAEAGPHVVDGEADGVEGVADLVGQGGGEAAHRGRALGDAEPLLEDPALPEPLHHLVERAGQRAELVAAGGGDPGGEISRRDASRRVGQGLHRPRDGGGEDEGQQHAEGEDGERRRDAARERGLGEHGEVVEDAGDDHVADAPVPDHDRDGEVRGGGVAEGGLVAEHAADHVLRRPAAARQLLADDAGVGRGLHHLGRGVGDGDVPHPEPLQLLRVGLDGLLEVRPAPRLLLRDLDGGGELLRVVADAGEQRALAEEVQHEEAADGEHEQREHHELQLGAERPAPQPAQRGCAHPPSLAPPRLPPKGRAPQPSGGRRARA